MFLKICGNENTKTGMNEMTSRECEVKELD